MLENLWVDRLDLVLDIDRYGLSTQSFLLAFLERLKNPGREVLLHLPPLSCQITRSMVAMTTKAAVRANMAQR